MELLDAHRGRDHGMRTAALLRRSHPSDKELQVAGLLHGLAREVRPLLGARVAGLAREHPAPARPHPAPDAETLRQASESATTAGLDAGVMEDWRPVLELLAARVRGVG
ncbi:hypothetical protein [Streptomyces sp. Isolate_45]|uniref:hypothetical protein n=1 Tax=unclassified Streptomyces TaxID=2593676 RepID=UPI00248206A7|nr:hypothetical protein [Streptomyces sp. Isolate_45]MDA5284196.1 hypothetical protein [Streptomyces sp. Isolate_45]